MTGEASGAVLDVPQIEKDQCNHHWVIESPRGQTSSGICKFCRTSKEFDNWGPDAFKYGDMSDVLAPRISDLIDYGKREVASDTLVDSL